MRVLVTGGSGYIGSHVCRLLSERGDEVVVADDFVTGLRHRIHGFDALSVDLDSDDAVALVSEFARAHGVEAIIHFAARKQVAESVSEPLKYMRDNVGGLINLLAAAEQAGVSRIIFSSSAAVYGNVSGRVTEDHRCDPVNPYGRSKLVGEWLMQAFASRAGVAALSLRYFNVAGAGWPDLADEAVMNLVPMVLERLRAGDSPKIFGRDYYTEDGTCVRDFVHVMDVAEAHLAALDSLDTQDCPHRAFNVGTGSGSSVLQVVEGIRARWVDAKPAAFLERRAGDPPVVVADASSIEREIGWRARRTIGDILDSVV